VGHVAVDVCGADGPAQFWDIVTGQSHARPPSLFWTMLPPYETGAHSSETVMTTTRFAPSPTGYIHIGNLRTALMNFLIARQSGGSFILRIDDTDPERSKETYVDAIKQDLEWLGLEWDRVERQSERLDQYNAAADTLRDMGRFYEAFETPVELDLKRKKQLNMGKPPVYDRAALALSAAEQDALRAERGAGVWRFKLDQSRIEWNDGILGAVSIDAARVSDPVRSRAGGQRR